MKHQSISSLVACADPVRPDTSPTLAGSRTTLGTTTITSSVSSLDTCRPGPRADSVPSRADASAMPFPDSTACFRPQENGQLLTKFDRFTTIPRQISTEIAPVSPLTIDQHRTSSVYASFASHLSYVSPTTRRRGLRVPTGNVAPTCPSTF